MKVGREDGAQVGRVDGEDARFAQSNGLKGRTVLFMLRLETGTALARAVRLEHAKGHINAEDWIFAGERGRWLAAVLLYLRAPNETLSVSRKDHIAPKSKSKKDENDKDLG